MAFLANKVDGIAVNAAGTPAITNAPLSANGTYSTGWLDIQGYKQIYFTMIADQIGSITTSFSGDGVNVLTTGSRAYNNAGSFFRNAYPINTRYVKYDFTNGSTLQTVFWLQVYLTNSLIGTSNFDLNQRLTINNLAGTNRAILETPDNTLAFDLVYRTGNSLNVNVTNPSTTLPDNAAKETGGNLAAILSKLSSDPATQTTLAAVLTKLSSDPATQTTLALVLAKLSSDPATQTGLTAILNKLSSDPATQTTLAAVLAKITSDPATQTTLAAILTAINSINTDQGAPADSQATNSTASWGEISLLKGILQRPATSAITNVATLVTSIQILAANANRKGASIFSISGTILISLGSTNSATQFTSRIITNAIYEVPFGYTGAIYAIGAGSVAVTELT